MKKASWKEVLFMYVHMVVDYIFYLPIMKEVSFNVSYFSLSTNVTTLLMLLGKKRQNPQILLERKGFHFQIVGIYLKR